MYWAIAALVMFSGIIVQLRFLCLSQNNAYKLPIGKPLFRVYLPFASLIFLIFLFVIISETILFQFVYVGIAGAILHAFGTIFTEFTHRIHAKLTKRAIIKLVCVEIVYIVECVLTAILIKDAKIIALALCPVVLSVPILILLLELPLNYIFEKKNREFVKIQSEKLIANHPIVIGITGSYGKTSCKNTLRYFLEDKYCVATTEKNFNTPMGISISISKLCGCEQVFIAEFGARKQGDIEELCHYFPPNYGIVTGVCPQHLQTFLTEENIYQEKFLLAKSVAKNGGTTVFNINDKQVFRMWKEHKGKKLSAGTYKKGDIYATEIELSMNGSNFNLHVKDKVFPCHTALLGRHNIQNIVMCSALALELGCNIENIIKKIGKLPQIPHRLEYIFANGVHILDDGYNANIYGVKSALEVLKNFPARHIVVSQGIVELGDSQREQNENIGKELANVADVVILCGINAKDIQAGLKNNNYCGRIICLKSFKEVQKTIKETVKKGDTLLLQNDIPDIY